MNSRGAGFEVGSLVLRRFDSLEPQQGEAAAVAGGEHFAGLAAVQRDRSAGGDVAALD
jgi:hypothetical protein